MPKRCVSGALCVDITVAVIAVLQAVHGDVLDHQVPRLDRKLAAWGEPDRVRSGATAV
jgi:hypothetical protein